MTTLRICEIAREEMLKGQCGASEAIATAAGTPPETED